MSKSYQIILLDQLQARQRKNPQFSLRAFARVLDVSPSHLSSLLSGRKKLSAKVAHKMVKNLSLEESASKAIFQELIDDANVASAISTDLQLLQEDEFSLISEWYHFAILSLGKLDNQSDPDWIADRLGIKPHLASQALGRLQRLGLIEIQNGRFHQSSRPLTTTSDIPSKAIRSYHRQNLKLAIEKLENTPVEQREFSSITMAAHPKMMAKAKKMIHEFRHRLCTELESLRNPTEVYTLSVQLFPVTNKRNSL